MDFSNKASDKVPILFENKNYNSTSVSSLDTQQSGQQVSQEQSQQSQLPVVYCMHGNLANGCCKIEQALVAHCHTPRVDGVDKKARRKLIIACCLCVFFMIIEIIGGVLSNSLAIATDAAHLLTDFASFLISLFAVWLAGRPSTKRLSFGWYRAEVIGALISVLMIWVVTGVLVFWAIHRLRYQDFELDASYMLLTSIIGVIVNIIMGCALHQHGHSHGHAHGSTTAVETVQNHSHTTITLDDGQTRQKNTSSVNINVRAAFIHVVGDFLQSVGVFVAALIIYFKPEYIIADPICTFIFSIFVMITTFTIIKDALMVLMEGTPGYMDYEEIVQTFLQINGVKRVHNLRVWALSINKVALIAHLAIDQSANPELILKEATARVHGKYDLFETTLQIEYFNPTMEDCTQCQLPSV